MKKRLFIGLLGISLVFVTAIFAAAWWLVAWQRLVINQVILVVLTCLAITILLILGVGVAALIWTLWRSRTIPSLQSAMATATNLLFPLTIHIGKWVGLEEESIKNSFIQVSNQLVKNRIRAKRFQRIMILAPHCLQWVHCPHKITIDINNCKDCGKCPISQLRQLAQKYAARLYVVTGGTFARKVIKDYRPQAVVAIACERDLTSGIQEVSGIPVIGIVNERPEGPCCNTIVDLDKVEAAIRYFNKGGKY